MKAKLVIFDFDGVIQDSWQHSYDRNLRDWPDLTPDQHRKFFNGNVHDEVAKMPPPKFGSEETNKWLEEHYYPTKLALSIFNGIDEVIKKLVEDHILVINTSAREESTRQCLETKGLAHYFSRIYGVEVSRDKVEKFKQILSDNNVKPEETLFITDTVGDVLDAKECSIPTIAVTYGYQDRSYFEPVESCISGFADEPRDILKFT